MQINTSLQTATMGISFKPLMLIVALTLSQVAIAKPKDALGLVARSALLLAFDMPVVLHTVPNQY